MSKLVILARDGVINQDTGQPIADPNAWQPIPGSLEAIARLNQAGYRVAIATNQPGLSDGSLNLDALNEIHHLLHDRLDRIGGHLVAIAYCPHTAADACTCRKPAEGMYLQLAERFGVEMTQVTVIGDRRSDVQPALHLGARSLLVRTGRLPLDDCLNSDGSEPFDDLAHAVSALLVEE